MKNITSLAFLMLSFTISAQTTYAIYSEDPNVGAGLQHLRFSNGQGFSLTEPTNDPYEGAENYLLSFNGTSPYFHAIFIPRNSSDTSDMAIDISAYGYYNVSFKTTSPTPFYIRMRGNGITAKVSIDPASNTYGFTNDGQWHFMSIPFSDFIPESASFSLANITEIFVLRSNISGSTAGTDNDFEFDNIYVSTDQVMAKDIISDIKLNIYPNPTSEIININIPEAIDYLELYDLVGKRITNISLAQNNTSVNLSSLEDGMYILKITTNGKVFTSKVIKK